MYEEGLHNHIVKLLKAGVRLDGRKLLDYRKPIKVEYGVSKTAEGSARVHIENTDVMVGVKMEVGEPYPDMPDQGTIIVGAELTPLANPNFELGPPGIDAIELARVVDRGIRESKALDFKKLCIKKGEKVWLLLIDIIPINDDGNLIDASALAVLAALKDANFPKYDEKTEKIDYKEKTDKKVELTKEPIAVTVVKIGDSFIVDPTTEEEKVIDTRVTISTKKDGSLCAIQKGGDMPLTSDEIMQMVDIAIEKAKELREVL
ncbi:exosome complex protein Rrp42 [Candidatus Woesearchaeota archaeon]|nr:exosome complex protein Rrp42 [Candidatus Woesearchaeota archaeon]